MSCSPPSLRLRRCLPAAFLSLASLFVLGGGGCPPPGNGGGSDTITEDTTLDSLNVAAGETLMVENNAVVTITGDATIDGTVESAGGRLKLVILGAATINGTLKATDETSPELPSETPFNEQPVGVHLVIGDGGATFGEDVVVNTNGHVVVTDAEDVLTWPPSSAFDQVENVAEDDLATLVPLPPDDPAFDQEVSTAANKSARRAQGAGPLAPILIQGTWPPAGAPAPAGDQPVVIFRFNGNRPLNLGNWTVNGPPAPAGANADESDDAGDNATGRNGRRGMRLNIWNNGGPINVVGNVTLNLADGGNGGNATASCASATGGNGAASGNFRMTAAGGIDLTNGTLTINPGASGSGGEATVTKGAAGAAGCAGSPGANSTATGGNGADNTKRIYARGNVSGLANVTIGLLVAGDGGPATATACDGGPGIACCDGGRGGAGTANGGTGGDASLNLSGLPINAGLVFGGDGGDATATGGNGGNGGPCKFGDGGDGGDGGTASATAGGGGRGTGPGGGGLGGNGGDAIANGGNGGNGGDSGFGTPGSGGALGTAAATAGTAGTGDTAGAAGEATPTNGSAGAPGGALGVVVFCFPLNFLVDGSGDFDPGPHTGPIFSGDGATNLGTLGVNFPNTVGAELLSNTIPVPHIGLVSGAQMEIDVASLMLPGTNVGTVGGLRLEPLFGNGLSEQEPMIIQALGPNGELLDEQAVTSLPDNFANPTSAQTVDVLFNVEESVTTFRLITPPNAFVTLIRCYLLDP